MIKSLNKMNEYPTAKHKMTLHPEWDVLSALNTVLNMFPNRPRLEWVKSHQDDNDEGNENERRLELSAQLNVMADELATIGLQQHFKKLCVPMDPNSCIQLHMNKETITRDLKQTVRTRVQMKSISDYYCARFGWSLETMINIDWNIFSYAYLKRIKKKLGWTNKFHVKKLPTGKE